MKCILGPFHFHLQTFPGQVTLDTHIDIHVTVICKFNKYIAQTYLKLSLPQFMQLKPYNRQNKVYMKLSFAGMQSMSLEREQSEVFEM